jgi:hypothetical protein
MMANGKTPPVLCYSMVRSHAAGFERRENEAEDVFQRSENKKSSRPEKTLRIAPASFILACSPALEGTMLNVPGRSSGSWFALLPAPSHLAQ